MSDLTIENINGRITKFGPESHEGKFGSTKSRVDDEVVVEYRFDWNGLPAEGVNEMIHTIPKGAFLRSSELVVTKAFVGSDGSSSNPFITAGLYEPEGTVIDADGVLSVAALTDIDAVNDTIVAAGALVNTAVTEDAQLRVALDGSSSLTAGQAVLRLRYNHGVSTAAGSKTF